MLVHAHDGKVSTFIADETKSEEWHQVTAEDVKFLQTVTAMAASFVQASVIEGARAGLQLPVAIEVVKSALVQQILALKGS